MRPGALDELGLVKTLESEAREFQGHTGIACRFKTNTARTKFDRSAAVAIFRIVQAALTNVARHARASRAVIALIKKKDGLILTVTDNGKGISKALIYRPDSLGIAGMRERSLALDGTFTLGRSRTKGTKLKVWIPLSRVLSAKASS